MFHNLDTIPSLRRLEENWSVVRDELRALEAADFAPWPERELYAAGSWNVFGFYAFSRRLERNCGLCPQTVGLVEALPGMVTAGFSRLEPGAEIEPHRGYEAYAGQLLRCHLGLEVPPDCGLRVGDEVRQWEAGRCLLFDDSFEHAAWNRSNSARTVLLVDLRNPLQRSDKSAKWQLTEEAADFLAAQEFLNRIG